MGERDSTRGQEERSRTDHRGRRRKLVLLVAAAALIVFLPSVMAGFVFDDIPLITQNEFIHSWRWLPRAFTTHLWDVSRLADAADVQGAVETPRRYYRPLVTVSLLVTWMAVGAAPWAFHLTNVLLHAATAALATRAAIRWTGSLVLGGVVAAVFAIHPTRTENVTWISGRMDVMMLFFGLVALEAFRAFERRSAVGGRAWPFFAGGMLALVASILSKEPGVMMPLLLLAREGPSVRRRSALVFGASSALGVAYLAARALVWPPEGAGIDHAFTPGHFLVTVGAYFQRACVPWPPTMYFYALAFDDARRPLYSTPFLVLGAIVVCAGLVALVVAWRRSRPAFWLLVAAVCFIGPLLNVYYSGLQVSAQDRFLYAPLLFATAGIARLLRDPLRRIARRRVFALGAGGVALAAIALVELRTLDYRNEDTFWAAELAHSPDNPHVLQMLGRLAAARGELEEAYGYYTRAERPESKKYRLVDDIGAHFQRAAVLAALLPDGRIEELRALLDELWRAVEPGTSPQRRMVLDFEVGTPLSANGLRSLAEMQKLHWDVALLATRTGDFDRAARVLDGINPNRVAAHPLNGALVLARLGRLAEARELGRKIADRSSSFGDIASTADLQALGARLDRAEQIGAARDHAASPAERSIFEALRLAELGVYASALRVLNDASLLDAPDAAPLVMQLLVACRLDDAARELGARTGAPDAVAPLTSELPPRLRAMPPAPGGFEQVRAGLQSAR